MQLLGNWAVKIQQTMIEQLLLFRFDLSFVIAPTESPGCFIDIGFTLFFKDAMDVSCVYPS